MNDYATLMEQLDAVAESIYPPSMMVRAKVTHVDSRDLRRLLMLLVPPQLEKHWRITLLAN